MMYQILGREDDADLQLLLIGKTGSGKSATGNTILNDRVFESEMRSSSVTRVCQKHTGSVSNRRVTVIDTPDFIFSTHTDLDSDSELKKALELCSAGAHVILLFLPLGTFTEQEMDFISWFEQKFGAEALRFTLVLFTHADQRHMRTIGEMIRANPQLSVFINRCGQRYHEFNIKAAANRRQVTELMEKISRLVTENTNSRYTLEMMEDTERIREEEKRRDEERKEREHQMMLDRVRRETEIRVRRHIEQEIQEKERRGGTEEEIRAEFDKPKSKESKIELQDSFWNFQYFNIDFGSVVGVVSGTFGAVVGDGGAVGGAIVGAGGAVSRTIGAVSRTVIGAVSGTVMGVVSGTAIGVVSGTVEAVVGAGGAVVGSVGAVVGAGGAVSRTVGAVSRTVIGAVSGTVMGAVSGTVMGVVSGIVVGVVSGTFGAVVRDGGAVGGAIVGAGGAVSRTVGAVSRTVIGAVSGTVMGVVSGTAIGVVSGTVEAVVGAGGAVVGSVGAVVGAASGTFEAVGGLCGIIVDKVIDRTYLGAGSTSNLMNTEEFQSNKLTGCEA